MHSQKFICSLVAATVLLTPAAHASELWKTTLSKGQDAYDAKHYADAEKLLTTAVSLARREQPESVNEAKCLGWLGKTYSSLGQNDKAEDCFRHSLKIREKLLGENSPETGQVLQNLSWLLFNSEKKTEAIEISRRVLSNVQFNSGKRSKDAVEFMQQLAMLLDNDTAKTSEIEQLYKDALSIEEEKAGASSDEYATAANAYTNFLISKKQYVQASELQQKLLSLAEKQGASTAKVADILDTLAFVAQKQGEHTKAISLLERCLDIRAEKNSPDIAETLEDLGKNYQEQERYVEAEPFLRNALTRYRKQPNVSTRTLINAIETLALNLHELQKYGEAEILLRELVTLSRKTFAPNDLELAISLHNLSRCLRAEKKYDEAEELIDESIKIKRAQPQIDELDYASSLRNMARILTLQTKFKEAIPYYQESIEIFKKHDDKTLAALNTIGLANDYLELNDYGTAENLLLGLVPEKLNTYSKTNPFLRLAEGQRATVASLSTQRKQAQSTSELAKVELLIQTAIKLQSLGGDGSIVGKRCFPLLEESMKGTIGTSERKLLVLSLIDLATVMASNNEVKKAEQALAWAGDSVAQVEQPKDRVECELQIAYCLQLLSDYASANKYINLAVNDSAENKESRFAALNGRARLLINLSEYKAAKVSSEEAVTLGAQLYGANSAHLCASLLTAAESLLALGELDEALAVAKSASEKTGITDEEHAQALLLVGQTQLAQGSVDKAAETFTDIIDTYRQRIGDADLKTAAVAASYLGQCYLLSNAPNKYKMAQSEFASSLMVMKKDGSDTDLLNKAQNLDGLAQVSYMVANQQGAKPVSVFEKNYGESKLADGYALSAAACIDKYIYSAFPGLSFAQQCDFIKSISKNQSTIMTVCGNPTSIKQAYGYQMKWKGLLLESLRQRAINGRNATANPQLEKLLVALADARHQLVALSYSHADSDKNAIILNQATTIKENLEREIGAITGTAIEDPMSQMNATKFCQLLQPDEAFIDVISYRPFSSKQERYAAIVSRRSETGKVDFLDLEDASHINEVIKRWRAATISGIASLKRDVEVEQEQNSTSESQASYGELTKQLGNILLPIKKLIGSDNKITRMWICPEGEFARVPWNSIPLILSYSNEPEVCEVDSAREFLLLRKNEKNKLAKQQVLLAGLSDFERSGLPALPGALQEVQTLQELAKKLGIPVQECLQDAATKQAVTDGIEQATMAHIATHGFIKTTPDAKEENKNSVLASITTRSGEPLIGASSDPLLDCGIFLSRPKTPSANSADDLLTAEELATLDLSKCDLVTLSACQTGLGRGLDGQGVIGLRSAILSAGAKCMLMSLWSIDDESSRELMKRFYSHLWSDPKISKVEALRQAQSEIKNIPQWSEPKYWAGWVLTGEGFN